MTDRQRIRCHAIIHGASASAGAVGAGFAQLPGAHAVLIVPIQVAMIAALGRVFGLEVTKTAARSVIYATLGTMLGRGATTVLPRFIPGVGNVLNATVAAGITEALGWALAQQMEVGEFNS